MSDNVYFYLYDPPSCSKGSSHVKILETLFGGCRNREVYKDLDNRAEVLNFGVDNTKKRLIILTGIKNLKNRRDKFLTIFDIDTETVLYTTKIVNKEVIGRLKSNLYNFVEGHIYFGNSLFKIRYDLIDMNAKDGKPICESQLFDTYHNILPLDDNAVVQSGTPLQTCLYNRLAFIVRNHRELKARQLLIMPYLHERRIYLNRRHLENQFYTIKRHMDHCFIQCMCFDAQKMYVYTETGKLIDRYVYAKEAKEWGKP